ncbi:uncharacterized protein LOC143024750 [Oratosquilla oratoria]|uniref:uncharacterized protein LOC143024750 n=1 Tax=Oratosquilla oratoria TaxID=337810 RepID=UPI003F771FB8
MMSCSSPKVNNFLCCWSVRTGSLFLGSCELLLFTSTLLGMLYSFDYAVTIKIDPRTEGPEPALIILYIVVVVVSVITMLLSGLEVCGVLYEKPALMIPYMVFIGLRILIALVCIFVFPVLIVIHNPYSGVFSAAVSLTFLIIAIALFHCWLVLFTQYKNMKYSSENQSMRLTEVNTHDGYGFVPEAEESDHNLKIV